MKRLRTVALGIAALVVLSGCDVITRGHVDAIAIRRTGGTLEVLAKNSSEGSARWQAVDDLAYVVDKDAKVTVPDDPAFAFLGAPGASSWILPQVEDEVLPWIGWNTEGIPSGFVAQNRVRWRMLSVAGPGEVALFTTDPFGGPQILFNSRNGLPDSVTVPVGTHAHGNWSFSAPGGYAVRYEISATLAGGGTFAREFLLWFAVVEDDV